MKGEFNFNMSKMQRRWAATESIKRTARGIPYARTEQQNILLTVSNKKTHLAVFETCVFRVYLRNHLSYKIVFYIHLHPRLKSF